MLWPLEANWPADCDQLGRLVRNDWRPLGSGETVNWRVGTSTPGKLGSQNRRRYESFGDESVEILTCGNLAHLPCPPRKVPLEGACRFPGDHVDEEQILHLPGEPVE